MKRFAVIQAVWISAAGILFFSTLLDASWDLGRLLEGTLVAGFVVSILYLAFIVSNPFFRKLNRVVFSLALIVSVQIMVFIGHYLVPFLSIVDVALDAEAQDVLLRRRLVLGFILSLIWMRSIHIRNRMREREASELQAKVQALQSRIRPHFLFNSMNIIAALIPVDPDRAERAVEDLSEIFPCQPTGSGDLRGNNAGVRPVPTLRVYRISAPWGSPGGFLGHRFRQRGSKNPFIVVPAVD